MNLDNHIQGDFDQTNPINQNEEPEQDDRTVEEFINDKNTLGAILRIEEIRFEVNSLRRYANNTNNQYFLKRLTKIYNQL